MNCSSDYSSSGYGFYEPDVSDSSLYEQSFHVNCVLQKNENERYSFLNESMNKSYLEEASTSMRCYIERDQEHKLRVDHLDNKYRCHVEPPNKQSESVDCVGYECNQGMMYKLDNFNTYNNYPVCKIRDEKISCCPENIQIFDNITRRNIEILDTRPKHELIVDSPIIPKLVYNKCFYK